MEEMRQSARIVKQALDGMPSGPDADAPHVVLPDREKMKLKWSRSSITSRSLLKVSECRRARYIRWLNRPVESWAIT